VYHCSAQLDDNRYNCLTAPVETPGCRNSEGRFGQPPNRSKCGGHTGRTNGHGIQNATIEDITVEAFTTQNLFFMAPTKAGGRVSRDITVRRLECNGTWADGMNIHGRHRNVLIEDSTVRYSGDDSFATWSIGDGQDNITFRGEPAVSILESVHID
jgi:hypothetical protein